MSHWKDMLYFSKADRRALLVFCTILVGSTVFRMWWYPSHSKQLEIPVTDSIESLLMPESSGYYSNNSTRQNYSRTSTGNTSELETGQYRGNQSQSYQSRRNQSSNQFQSNQYQDNQSQYRSGNGQEGNRNQFGNGQNGTNQFGNGQERNRNQFGNGQNGQELNRNQFGNGLVRNDPEEVNNFQTEMDQSPNRSNFIRQPKLARGETLDLNTADTTELKMVPGIGSYYARKILEYKSQLGGYTEVRQLSEIRGLPDSVQQWFVIMESTMNLQPMDINAASITQLNRHPYISFQQARAIVDARKAGRIRSVDRLRLLDEFPDSSLQRLLPYLDFSDGN